MKKIFLVFLISIILLSFISAKSSVDITPTSYGLNIQPTLKDYLRTNTNHEFEIHVFNITSGYPVMSGISCYMHLYSRNGTHIYTGEDTTIEHLFDYSFELDAGNFSERGEYQAKFQCNNSDSGGAEEIFFFVNDYGEELSDADSSTFNYSMIFLMVLFVMAIIGIFSFENPSGKLACYWIAHLLFIVGTFSVWQFNYGYAIGFVGLAGVWKVLFYVSIISMFPMVLLSIAWMFYIHTMNDDIKKLMDRGMDENEAYERSRKKRKW